VGSNQNAFNIINPLATGDDTDNNDATTVTQTEAVATTGSTFAASAAYTTFPEEVTAAIQQLAANQTSMMQQFAVFSVNPHTAQCNNLHVPPVHNIHVPAQQAGGFQQQLGRFQQGRGGRCGGGCSQGGGQGMKRGGCGCTTYNTGFVPPQFVPQFGGTQQVFVPGANTGGVAPVFASGYAPAGRGQRNPEYSNQNKLHNNWNMCYSHGFDVENGHTSATCEYRKMDHQEGFTRKNAQGYIDAGYASCTKGMHKNVLPMNF
jgi:hypothetical protein